MQCNQFYNLVEIFKVWLSVLMIYPYHILFKGTFSVKYSYCNNGCIYTQSTHTGPERPYFYFQSTSVEMLLKIRPLALAGRLQS